MPLYTYKCKCCGRTEDAVRKIEIRNEILDCRECDGPMHRDVAASMQGIGSGNTEYAQPVFSESMGVEASQVPAAQALHPHIKYQSDGRIRIDSHAEYARVRRDLGFVDKSKR